MLYWNIGKIINTHKSWGNKLIENFAQDIKLDFPDMKGFTAPEILQFPQYRSA